MPAELSAPTPLVTADQLDLVKRTVADGATADELRLYLFDCARQGVHPLDKLLHFTKRGGKYTPVTSIDFMRQRAADTGEYAGNDDAVFKGDHDPPSSATVTVWRLTQGQRFAYTGTARWSEYKPEQDFLWRKMPHTMLGKCAEALALRKAFPKQLAGLYVREEMDQAGPLTSTAPPVADELHIPPGAGLDDPEFDARVLAPPMESYATIQALPPEPESDYPPAKPKLPEGVVTIVRVDSSPTKNPSVRQYFIVTSTGQRVKTIKDEYVTLAKRAIETGTPMRIKSKTTQWGDELVSITTADDGPLPF